MSEETFFTFRPDTKEFDGFSRLIPRCRSHSIEEGIQGKIKDALWFLSRQQELGEFRVRSGGKIVRAELSTKTKAIDSIKLGTNSDFQELENKDIPLEPVVENEVTQSSENLSKPESWDTQRLEYRFSIKCGETILEAKEYFGDRFDWYYLNLASDVNFDGVEEFFSLTPSAVSFPGKPHPDWWRYEDGNVDLGDIRSPNLNFLSMLLIEFALIYSNDWFIIPLSQPVGSLQSIENLTAIDTFGIFEQIRPVVDFSEDEHLLSFFTLSGSEGYPSAGSRLLFLPNTVVHVLKGEPVEEISISRDELANLVWAIEHKYLSQGGTVVNRDDEEARKIPNQPEIENHPKYRLKSYVPLNWIPYKPVQKSQKGDIILRRGRTDENASSDPSSDRTQYRGQIIRESKKINEEEIPSTTLELTRKFKLIAYGPEEWELIWDEDISKWKLKRTKSKEIHVWMGRNKRPGKRQPSSKLLHDYLMEKK